MSNPTKNPFTDLGIQFVRGTPKKPLIPFNEMIEYFSEIDPKSMVPGNNYLVFSQSRRNPRGGSYIIVKYLSIDAANNITISELFRRNKETYGWSNTPKLMKGSRFFKEIETYPANEVYFDEASFNALTDRQKDRVQYFFRDIGDRRDEFNNRELTDENVNDIIEEIVADQQETITSSASATTAADSAKGKRKRRLSRRMKGRMTKGRKTKGRMTKGRKTKGSRKMKHNRKMKHSKKRK